MRRRTRRRHLPWFVLLAELGLVSGQAACTGDPGIEESASDATTTATSTSMTTTSTPTGSPTTTTTTTTSTSSTSIGPSCDCPPEDPDECPPGGDELLSQGLVRCLDSTCAEVDEVYFEDLSIFSGFEDELSHELECDVRDRVVEGDGAEVWRLRDCAGIDPAAEFGLLLRFQSSLPVGLPLSIGERVKLSVPARASTAETIAHGRSAPSRGTCSLQPPGGSGCRGPITSPPSYSPGGRSNAVRDRCAGATAGVRRSPSNSTTRS